MTHESDFSIHELVVPDSVDDPDAADFLAMVDVRSRIESEGRDTPVTFTAAEMLPNWKNPSAPIRGLVATVDGRVVGRTSINFPASVDECWANVGVLPEFRGRGIGAALYDGTEALAREEGRRTILTHITFVASPESLDDGIAAPTGFGRVPRDLTSTRFLSRSGFSLEQVARHSRLILPLDAQRLTSQIDAMSETTSRYRTATWQGRTPEEWVEGMAVLRTRMSTDAPSAGLQLSEDVWDADRIRSSDDLWQSSPRTLLTTIAIDVRTDEPVGYTELDIAAELDRAVEQVDTLVLREHRGHSLGMLLKLVNLRELESRFAGRGAVETTNAEENLHVIRINEALGFAPVSYAARWQKAIG